MQNRHKLHSSLVRRKSTLPPWIWFTVIAALFFVIMAAGMVQAQKEKEANDAMGMTTFYGSTTPTSSDGRHIP